MHTPFVNPWQWGLYDFANSLANIAVSFYFALWFVEDFGASDAGISITVALVTIFLLGSLPQIGARIDRRGNHVRVLTFYTLGVVATLLLLTGTALFLPTGTPFSAFIILATYGLFQYLYQSSVSLYTSLLRFVAQEGKNEEIRVAGIGNALGQLGNVVGIFAALAVSEAFSRPVAFFGGAVLFLLFSSFALLWLKRLHTTPIIPPELLSFKEIWGDVRKSPDVFHYLLGYYFFADAILTLQLFISLYLGTVGHLSDDLKAKLIAGALIIAVIGALLSKRIAARITAKRAIEFSILGWGVLLALFALSTNPTMFVIVTLLNGFAFGVLFSLSQGYYATLIPKHAQARYFGIYTIFERASSLLGPLLWSAIIILFSQWDEGKYRIAVLSLALLILVSFFFIRKVQGPAIQK